MLKQGDSKKHNDRFSYDNEQPVRSAKSAKTSRTKSRQDLRAALQDLSMLNQRIHVR